MNGVHPLIAQHLPAQVINLLRPVLGENLEKWQVYGKDDSPSDDHVYSQYSKSKSAVYLSSKLEGMITVVVMRVFRCQRIDLATSYQDKKKNIGGPSFYPPVGKVMGIDEDAHRLADSILFLQHWIDNPEIEGDLAKRIMHQSMARITARESPL